MIPIANKSHAPNPAKDNGCVIRWLLPILLAAVLPLLAVDPPRDQLPKMEEYSAKGLELRCSLAKTNFAVGEPVNVWCLVTNTTDSVKPIVWHPSAGSHFVLTTNETTWMEGVLPLVIPQLREEFKIKSTGWSPEYLLFLPAHSSANLLLTYKPDRPQKFKGRVVYDPATHGGGFFGEEALKKAREACAFSNTFEYEVTKEKR